MWTPKEDTILMEDLDSSGNAERENVTSLSGYLEPDQNKPCSRDLNAKLKKSVSFEEDVTVYLFDQEKPTLKLLSDSCTSLQNSFSCNQLAVTSEDSDLQWDDDFSVLEKSCCFHFGRLSHSLTLPTQSWTSPSRPQRSSLSQTCLFLTHVTESDLEL
uniref:Uncharacterized protein n=1 Tax=Nothobranchius pienaari TaxID=704102 RepID=A0A1A8LVM2_9TELE